MLKLKRLLVNEYERITHKQLSAVSRRMSAEVHPKVGLADVLPIEVPGLPAELYNFALKAHYDFLVTNQDKMPLFAVEFDGEPRPVEQLKKDETKNELSRRFNLPLHRISERDLSATDSGHDVLSEQIARWFEGAVADINMQSKWVCPTCQGSMIERHGKYGRFLSCERYPACKGIRNLPQPLRQTHAQRWRKTLIVAPIAAALVLLLVTLVLIYLHASSPDDGGMLGTDPTMSLLEKHAYATSLKQSDYPNCPKCGAPMVIRHNRRTGVPFFGCSKFPVCDGSRDIEYPKGNVTECALGAGASITLLERQTYANAIKRSDYPYCPYCGVLMVIRKLSENGEPYFGCSQFPGCKGMRIIPYPGKGLNGRDQAEPIESPPTP